MSKALLKRVKKLKSEAENDELHILVKFKDGSKKRYYDLVEGFIFALLHENEVEEFDLVGELIPDFMKD